MGEQACLWTSFKLKFIVNYWEEVDSRDQPGGPSGTAGDLRKVLKFRRLSSLQQLTLDFFSNMDWEQYIYLFEVISESAPSVLCLSLIENPWFFSGNLNGTEARALDSYRALQLAEKVTKFEEVDFGNDGGLGCTAYDINTMLKGIISSDAGSKLQVLSLPGSEGWFVYHGWSSLAEARERLTVNLLGIKPRRIILHDDLDSGSDDEDGDDVN